MAWQFDVNKPRAAAYDNCGFAIMDLINHLVAQGAATIVGSSDGVIWENEGQTAGPYNVFTSPPLYWSTTYYANRISNVNAWIRIRLDNSTVEICFRRYNNGYIGYDQNIQMAWSIGGFTGNDATATLPPTGGQLNILGSHRSGSSYGTWGNYNVDTYNHAACEDTLQDGFKPFYFFATGQGDLSIQRVLFFDVVQEKVGSDPLPVVLYMPGGVLGFSYSEIGLSYGRTYRDYGGGAQTYIGDCRAGMLKDHSNNIIWPDGVPAQAGDGLARDFPIIWCEPSLNFYKGISRNIRWRGTPRGYPNTVDLSTVNARIYVDHVLIPWKQNEAPL